MYLWILIIPKWNGDKKKEKKAQLCVVSCGTKYKLHSYFSVSLPGCWIRPGLQFRHMLWKASTAVNHPAVLQRFCYRHPWQRQDKIIESHLSPLRRPAYQSILSNPHPGNSLISRTHFYIYEITNSGLWNPKCPDVEPVGNRLLMQTLFQCQPWRCPLLDNM